MAGDFLAADRVILWSDEGHGYLYKLPAKWVLLNVKKSISNVYYKYFIRKYNVKLYKIILNFVSSINYIN